jgi:hypothetical protein
MDICCARNTTVSIFDSIAEHAAWHGGLPGLVAEKMIRGFNTPYTYLMREGEMPGHYYVTFLDAQLTVRHQPFVITMTPQGWHYENLATGGPYAEASIDDVIHLIMHCKKEQCVVFQGT